MMSPDFNAGFVILDAVTVTDIAQGRRMARLGDALDDEDALRALQCVARNDVDFAAFMQTMRKVVAVSALVYDGQGLTTQLQLNLDSEQDCLNQTHAMCLDWGQERKLFSLDAELAAHLCLRSLAYEENLSSLFELKVSSIDEALQALKGESPQAIRLWIQDVTGNSTQDWLNPAELEACCMQAQEKPIEQHCRVRLMSTCQLFMKYWVASGKLSKLKYRSLSKALDALFVATT